MKKTVISAALAVAAFSAQHTMAHEPLNSVPDLQSFKEYVQDWDMHESYYASQDIEVIDMHLHPGSYDKLGPKGKEFVKSVFPINLPDFLKVPLLRFISSFQLNPYGAFIGIKNECRRAGADHCILFSVYTPETWGIEPVEDLMDYLDDTRNQVDGETYFYGLAGISVQDWDNTWEQNIAKLETALMHPKIVGVKLAFAHTLTPFDDSSYEVIYKVAEKFDKPVYHHVGTSPLRRVSEFPQEQRDEVLRTFDPMYLESAIKRYPNVKFIMGHAGNDANQEGFGKIDEVFYLAKHYPNVYIEISALGSERSDPTGALMDSVMLQAKQSGLIKRVLYGSDGPGNPGNTKKYKERVLASMERVGYTFEEAQKVMADNARFIFKITD